MNRLKAHIKRFGRETRATLTAEAVIVLPLLLWVYGGMYVFWDAFKSQNINIKAAYTISDMVSREIQNMPQSYVDGLHTMLSFLNYDKHPVRLRLSFVNFVDDGGTGEFQLDGSEVRGPAPVPPFDTIQELPFVEHADTSLLEPHIPAMAFNDRVIVVETEMDYTPLFQFNAYPINPRIFSTVVVTRPRMPTTAGFEE